MILDWRRSSSVENPRFHKLKETTILANVNFNFLASKGDVNVIEVIMLLESVNLSYSRINNIIIGWVCG